MWKGLLGRGDFPKEPGLDEKKQSCGLGQGRETKAWKAGPDREPLPRKPALHDRENFIKLKAIKPTIKVL